MRVSVAPSAEDVTGLVVLISGAIASGKSIIANGLHERLGAKVLSSRAIILEWFPNAGATRFELQELGTQLEADTGGDWLAEAAAAAAASQTICAVDSVRTLAQVSGVRRLVPVVVHVHVLASEEVRRQRFEERSVRRLESANYEEAEGHSIEAEVDELAAIADQTVDTTQMSPEQALQPVIELVKATLGR